MFLTRSIFYLFLISIPFGTRILLYQFTNGFHEYEAVFLYVSDIFLILFLTSIGLEEHSRKHAIVFPTPQCGVALGLARPAERDTMPARPARRFAQKFLKTFLSARSITIFVFFSASSVFFAFSKGLAVYNFVRLVLLVLMALAVSKILKEGIVKLENIFMVIAGSAVFQSLLGIAQFFKQVSLGLGFLGEPVLGADIGGAAKIVVEGAKILRAYGTFPHPNVLAAFLILGLISLYYLWIKSTNNESVTNKRIYNFFLPFSIFVVSLGLLFAFSRVAWLIALLISAAVIIYLLLSHGKARGLYLAILVLVIPLILIIGWRDYVFARAKVAMDEPAVSYRLAYNELSLNLIKDRPLGVGIGNQVFYSVKNGLYQKLGMDESWQWQPIHNIYLLIASEIGILGLIAFLIFLGKSLFSSKNVIVIIVLLSLLAFGLVDHFLWTLQSGRLMLWIVIGILMGVNSAHRSMDRAQPSEG